jgi:hypothetical protein
MDRGSGPINGFADRVLATAAKDFEKPAGTEIDDAEVSSSRHPTYATRRR